jgi:glycosyltransferase involved in cell wall biosynthesis
MGQYLWKLLEPVAERAVALMPIEGAVGLHGDVANRDSTVGSVIGPVDSRTPVLRFGRGGPVYWEQSHLPLFCARRHVRYLLCPYNTAPLLLPRTTKLVVVVHDLIFLRPLWRRETWSASSWQNVGRLYRWAVVPGAIRRADVILTVSETTRGEILAREPGAASKVHVLPNTLGEEWYRAEPSAMDGSSTPLAGAPPRPFVLTVTGDAPHKNLEGLVDGWALLAVELRRRGLLLRVVGVGAGAAARVRALAARRGIGDLVELMPRVTDAELRRLYEQAVLFVFPSVAEGFGIPLTEAMAKGTVVACSDTSCLPEIAADAAFLFPPGDPATMAAVLLRALDDEPQRARLRELGLRRAQRFRHEVVRQDIARFWERIFE